MIKIYNSDIETNELFEVTDFTEIPKGAWINLVNPTEEEIKLVIQKLDVPEDLVRYSLDNDEQARIDKNDETDTILYILDVPIVENQEEYIFLTIPIGIILLRHEYIITVCLKEVEPIKQFEELKVKNFTTFKRTRFLLQFFYLNSVCFLEILRQINKRATVLTKELSKTMHNEGLLELLNLDNSLVYITTALNSNELIMEKTLNGRVVQLYEEDQDILQDAMIENKQAIEMGKIYSDVLSGTMQIYASIVSNNLSNVMKFLTAITIIISIPTLIASIWGMNVKLPFGTHEYGFLILMLISFILTAIVYYILKKKDWT